MVDLFVQLSCVLCHLRCVSVLDFRCILSSSGGRQQELLVTACELMPLVVPLLSYAGVPRLFDLVNVSDNKLKLAFW